MDAHTLRIPSDALDVVLAKSRRSDKAKAMIRECLVEGKPFNSVAKANGVSRQYVQAICSKTYDAWLRIKLERSRVA